MPKVFVPNKSGHDFSAAQEFGELIFMTDGTVRRYQTNQIFRIFCDHMQDAQESDYLLVCSLSILNAIATGILVQKFSKVNYLLFHEGRYLQRTLDLSGVPRE